MGNYSVQLLLPSRGEAIMTGEELNRKYRELCGWTFQSYRTGGRGNGGGFWHRPTGCSKFTIHSSCDCDGGRDLPTLHLDANLAIAEADRVFSREWAITVQRETVFFAGGIIKTRAITFCEAILKALIASKEHV